MANFESGIEDYLHFLLELDITFPIDKKGKSIVCCEYCKVFTGRRCAITEEVIFEPQKFVGFNCPLKKEESKNV
jgi:hypothetical protein